MPDLTRSTLPTSGDGVHLFLGQRHHFPSVMQVHLHLRIPGPAAAAFPGLTAHARLRLAQGDSLRIPFVLLPYEGPVLAGSPTLGPAQPDDLVAHLARPGDRAPWLDEPACPPEEVQRWLRGEAFRRCAPDLLLASLLGLAPDALSHGPRRVRIALDPVALSPLGIPGAAWADGLLRPDAMGFKITDGIHSGYPQSPNDLKAGYGDGHDLRLDQIADHLVMAEIDLESALRGVTNATHAVRRVAQVLDAAISVFSQQSAFGP